MFFKKPLGTPRGLHKMCPGLMLAALALTPPLLLAQVSAQPREQQQSGDPTRLLDACALIIRNSDRLACYDDLVAPEITPGDARVDSQATVTRGQADASPPTPETDDEDSGVMSKMLGRYVAAEKAIFSFSGTFVGHRPMYLLPISYMKNANREPVSPRTGTSTYDYDLDNKEAKYQISFKVPLLTGLLEDRTTLWFGYTQKSFWQVYNQDESAPFRETNYEPEIFLRYAANYDFGPGTFNTVTLGFTHQSNGQSEPRSRSWNRIVASAAYSYNRWLFIVQPWYRLPEAASDDDNVDIERYLGHANYLAVYRWTEDRTLSLKLMNNLRAENRTSVELGYSFPLGDTVKGFVHYYNGYGESLIDYNHRVQRIGIGIMLNDWL